MEHTSTIVDKPDFVWIMEKNIKFEIDFQIKNFVVISFNDNQFLYDHNFKSTKEMWDTLEMIYGVSPCIKQDKMNT